MDKEKTFHEESDNLGNIIKNLIDYDAQQRELISSELEKRDAMLADFENERAAIEEKYMQQAQAMLDALAEKQKNKLDKAVSAAKAASENNIAELKNTAAAKSEEWIEQIFTRTVAE